MSEGGLRWKSVQALFAGLCPDVRPVVVPLAALQAPPPSLAAALA